MYDICIIICYSPTKNAVFPIVNNKKHLLLTIIQRTCILQIMQCLELVKNGKIFYGF